MSDGRGHDNAILDFTKGGKPPSKSPAPWIHVCELSHVCVRVRIDVYTVYAHVYDNAQRRGLCH